MSLTIRRSKNITTLIDENWVSREAGNDYPIDIDLTKLRPDMFEPQDLYPANIYCYSSSNPISVPPKLCNGGSGGEPGGINSIGGVIDNSINLSFSYVWENT